MLLVSSLLLCLLLSFAACEDVLLKPIKKGKSDVGLIMIQGAQIKPDMYSPVMKAVQKASDYTLWVGIPEFTLDIAEPLVLKGGIERTITAMQNAGMKTDKIFYAGHSLGGATLQSFVKSNPNGVTGVILMGAFVSRGNYNTSYPVPTLTIGGELDGLSRVTRIMEGFYHQVLHSSQGSDAVKNSPVVVIQGLSHMQFASGDPPTLVKDRDLKPEISYDQAHGIIGNLSAAFMSFHLSGDKNGLELINRTVEDTKSFLKPLLFAFEMEGYAHFKPPCDNDPPSTKCTTGCPWSQMAQVMMGGLPASQIVDRDEFHPVYQIPVHLPKIDNNCSSPSPSCVLSTHTVSQCVYEIMDDLDTGSTPISAEEIRCKMSSRQAIMEAIGVKNISFNETDGSSICKVINQQSYLFAMNAASNKTVERFKNLGQNLTFGEDLGPYNAGPLWIWDPLKYKTVTDSKGRQVVEIRSPMMRTPTDYPVELAAGFHYCKLLSPARALEWIYVDGLRLYDSLNNSTQYN